MQEGACLLAIENSSNQGSAALSRGGELICEEIRFPAGRGNGTALFEPIEMLLLELEKLGEELDGVLVGTGPGNYSGVRIALGVGLGVSMAREVPLFGRGSFESYAAQRKVMDFWGIGDARRGRFFSIRICDGKQASSITLMTDEELVKWLEGDESSRCELVTLDEPERYSRLVADQLGAARRLGVSAAGLTLAFNRLSEKDKLASLKPQPFYLRAPNITPAKRVSPLAK